MNTFDWIVVGAGITGSSLAYELARQGLSVLLLDRHAALDGGTRFGYGGIAYWAGTTDLTRTLCAEGIRLHRSLSEELAGDTEFRELDAVLTIGAEENPSEIAQLQQQFALPPRLVNVAEACELEPLLNPAALSGALTVKQGHVNLVATAHAYTQAFLRLGGTRIVQTVTALQRENNRVTGVICAEQRYHSAQVAIAAGGMSRTFLQTVGISIRQYFTHSEQLETPPVNIRLRSLVMPAAVTRFSMEAAASQPHHDHLWESPRYEPAAAVLDAGAIQFIDGSIKIGQLSRTVTDPLATFDAAHSEAMLRRQVGHILPVLTDIPGQYSHCLVAFSGDRLPLVGAIADVEGLHLFSGFSNPLAIVPAVAKRFAKVAIGQPDPLIAQLSPNRFTT